MTQNTNSYHTTTSYGVACLVQADVELMENELLAEGGFEGAWAD